MSTDLFTPSLLLSATGAMDGPRLTETRPWLRAVARRHPLAVPPMLTIDLGTLLVDGPRPLSPPEVGSQDDLRSIASAYAEHVVGRLRAEPALLAVTDAVADAKDKATAVQVIVSRVASALLSEDMGTDLGLARRQIGQPNDELLQAAREGLAAPAVRTAIAAQLKAMIRAAKRQTSLLRPVDAFIVRHLDALESPSDQLAFAQIADAAAALARWVPRRVRARRTARGDAPTRVGDDSAYPVGGYSALATNGPIENLVSSELAYLEPHADLDLFDLRYVFGELLKYTRDESLWTRPRRRIDFVLTKTVLDMRVKVPTLPFQNHVMAQGAVVICVERLLEWLSASSLTLNVWVVDELDTHVDDIARLRLILADPIALGVTQVEARSRWDDLPLAAADPRDIVVFGTEPSPVDAHLVGLDPGGGLALSQPVASGDADVRGWAHTLTQLLTELL